jgi:hypothetical protein
MNLFIPRCLFRQALLRPNLSICNLGLIDKLFWEVSNPASTLYCKYLSFQEISNLTQNLKAADALLIIFLLWEFLKKIFRLIFKDYLSLPVFPFGLQMLDSGLSFMSTPIPSLKIEL